ncbi:MAG: flippase-like domain-containing protein [Natronospirillum sp.]
MSVSRSALGTKQGFILKLLTATIIAASFIWFVFAHYDLQSLQTLLGQLGLISLATVILLQLLSYILRAWRFYVVLRPLSPTLSFLGILRVTLIHNALNNIIPMRLGELTFPALMSRHYKMPIVTSASALVLVRLLDLALMGGLLVGVLFLLGIDTLDQINTGSLIKWTLIAATIGVAIVLLFFRQILKRVLLKLKAGLHYILPKMPLLLGISTFVWVSKVLSYLIIIQIALDSTYLQALVAVLATEATAILPINGIANFGTLEASIWVALRPFALDNATVFNAAVNLHFFILSMACTCGLLAYLKKPRIN